MPIIFVLSCQNRSTTQQSAETNEKQTEHTDLSETNTKTEIKKEPLSMNFFNLTDMEEKKLKMFVEKYYTTASVDFDVTEDEINLEISMLYQYLKKTGYKFVDNSTFNARINQFFGIDRRKNTYEVVEHSNFFTYVPFNFIDGEITSKLTASERAEFIKELELQETASIIYVKKYNFFISPVLPLGIFFDTSDGDDEFVFIQKDANRIKHYNNYVLNDSKSSLTWLLVNEQDFLTRLVKEFGYDKEPRINKMVLGNTYNELQKKKLPETMFLDNLFAAKDFTDGKLQIHEGLLQYTVDNTTVDDNRYLDLLYNYVNILSYNYTGFSKYLFGDFTKSEKLKIAAYAGYYTILGYKFRHQTVEISGLKAT